MKYFLKKTELKKGTYLQIYISEYHRGVGSRNRSFKAIGYVEDLKASGVRDPIAKAQAEVRRLNDKEKAREEADKVRKIGRDTPMKRIGYFVLKAIANSLPSFRKAVDAMASAHRFQYDVHDLMMALVYARVTDPESKRRTHSQVLPTLFEKLDEGSYSQVLSCCEYIGREYAKIVSFLTGAVKEVYGMDCRHTYFDCTNFYFEIDREDDYRRKGKSKENRHDPLVGMGLLLDADQIPVGMTLYPGNEGEQPKLRQMIAQMKKQNGISGRTIQVADKGLNCAKNVHQALLNGDGYLFSRSLRKQTDADFQWFLALDKEGWQEVKEMDRKSGKAVLKYRYHVYEDTFQYSYPDDDGHEIRFEAREKRIITFNEKLRMKKILELNRLVQKAERMCLSQARKDEFGECSRYVNFVTQDGRKARAELDAEAIAAERALAGYNMLVTSETHFKPTTIYNIYHNLWRIEQSFRMMKSYLDARPVFLQTPASINGHFLICYISVVLERILEFKVLNNRYNHERIMDFIRNFSLVRLNSRNYVNLLTSDDEVGQFLAENVADEITNYTITPSDISRLLKLKLNHVLLEV